MSPPGLRIELSAEEDKTLHELAQASTVPRRTRERAEVLRLNHRGWTTQQIAEYLDWRVATVRSAIYRWRDQGLMGLWDQKRSGRPPRLSDVDWAHLHHCLDKEEQTYTSAQLVKELEEKRGVQLSRRQLRRLLKKKISLETDPSLPSSAARPVRTGAKAS